MLLQIYVIELRNHLLQLLLLQYLFNEVLSLIPPPWLVQLAKILHNEGATLDAFFRNALGALALCVDAEVLVGGEHLIGVVLISQECGGVLYVQDGEYGTHTRLLLFLDGGGLPYVSLRIEVVHELSHRAVVNDKSTCLGDVVTLLAEEIQCLLQ